MATESASAVWRVKTLDAAVGERMRNRIQHKADVKTRSKMRITTLMQVILSKMHSQINPASANATAQTENGDEFFPQLSAHWKKNYAGWTAHVLTPDMKLPTKMRLKESRRVPMWNGPIECRLFRFDMVAGSARVKKPE